MNDRENELKQIDERNDKLVFDYMTQAEELKKHLNELFESIQRNIKDIRDLKEILKND